MGIETLTIPLIRQVIYDTYNDFPNTGLSVGDCAWATDRKCLYRWSGSAWASIGISSRHGNYADIGDPADYPESSLYQADDISALYMVVSGAWLQISTEPGMPPFAVGDISAIEALTEGDCDLLTYTKRKEIVIASGGNIRVSFDLRCDLVNYPGYGRIYKNGSPIGTARTENSGDYQTYTEDLSDFIAGDKVQLYVKADTEPRPVHYKNFKLKANKLHIHLVTLDT